MDQLQKALADMKSARLVAERRAAAESIEEYLDSDEFIVVKLNCNSVQMDKNKGDKMTWTTLFLEVRDYFIKESEKGSLLVQNKLFWMGLVRRVFEKATSNGPLLAWNRVYEFIHSHLQKERHASHFGGELMAMLQKFLEIDLYRSCLDAQDWNDLINTVLKCREKNYITPVALLSCLKICIARGSQYDLVIPCIRTRVVNYYSNLVKTNFPVVEQNILSYMQGLIALCNENAIEFRGILCALGETVIPSILTIPSFKDDENDVLIEFLLVQFSLHMPYDCDMKSHAFYAADNARWKEIVRLMYSYCVDIIEESGRKTSTTDGKLSERFFLLAAKCTKQISSPSLVENDNSDDEDESSLPKKKMRYKSFNTIISEVYRKPITEGLAPWLTYVKSVLNYFPALIENKMNFSNLMYLGTSLFNTRIMVRREFYDYFASLLKAEKYLRKKRVINAATDTWSTVWDLTLKTIPVCEAKEEAVNLLRKILKELHPTNITPLLMLYVNNFIPLLKCSLELLAEYLCLTTLPAKINDSELAGQNVFVDEAIAVSTCPRVALIRWLLKFSSSDIPDSEPLVAALMCSLIVNQTDVLLKQEVKLLPVPENVYNEWEEKLLKCSFVKETEFVEQVTKTSMDKELPKINFVLCPLPTQRFADAMQRDYDQLFKDFGRSGGTRSQTNYKRLISKVSLYLNVLNIIENHSIGESASSGQVGFRMVLERLFDNGMEKCRSIITERLQSGRSPETVTCVIEQMGKLFSFKLCEKMRTSLSQKVGLQVLEIIKRVFRSHLSTYIRAGLNNNQDGNVMFFAEDLESKVRMLTASGYDKPEELYLMTNDNKRYEKMSLTALKFLIDYGLICNHMLEHFTEIVKDLLAEKGCSAHLYMFDASALLISEMSPILSSPGLQDLIGSTIELQQKLCRGYHMFTHCGEKIWKLLKGLTHLFTTHEGVNRNYFMILFGTAYKLLEKNVKIPKTLYKSAFDALSELAKGDPGLQWSSFVTKSQKLWVLEEFDTLLTNKCHEVRQLAADTVCQMYEDALPFDYSRGISDSQDKENTDDSLVEYQDRRKTFLDNFFQRLLNCFDVEANLSVEEVLEESVNRISLALSSLTRLIFAYPYTQRQSIMFLFLTIKLKNIDVNIAKRALDYASPNSTKTMCCYLSYVLKKMLRLRHGVEDLPYQLLGCESLENFLTKFSSEICVEYFEQNRMADLEAFAGRFKLTIQNQIEQSYGLIMARLTPGLAISTFNLNQRGLNIAQYNEVHKRLINTLGGKEVTDTLMATCIGDVVLNLISLTFDPSVVNRWGCSEVKMTEPVPPHFPEDIIESCLKFLQGASPHKNISLIGYLAKTSHQSVYKIMLTLATRVHEAHDRLEQFWRLHQFSFFVDNLLLNEPKEIFSSMMEYVCSFTFNAYLRLLKTGNRDLTFLKAVIFLITKLVKRITEEYSEEMMIFYNPVIRGIVSVVVQHPTLVDSSKPLLDYLLKTNAKKFSNKITTLDPFPSHIGEFQDYNKIHSMQKYGSRGTEWPLTKEFERFLEGTDSIAGGSCTKERLQFLKELLSKRKRDLDRMVKNIEGKRFSEECEQDPLHRIINMLIGIASSSTRDEELATEACKCLGEIGPVDLSVLVLPPYKSQGKITVRDDALRVIIEIISGYLSSKDIQLVTVAGNVLRSLFEFEECADIANSVLVVERLYKVLLPFRCTDRQLLKKSVEKMDSKQLERNLNMNEMNDGIDYKSWMTQLTMGIIESFSRVDQDQVQVHSVASTFLPLCELRLDFCEDIFPYLVYLCLYGGRLNPAIRKSVSAYFRSFFNKFVQHLSSITDTARSVTPSSSGVTSTVIYLNKLALRTLVRAVQFLRRHPAPLENRGSIKERKSIYDNVTKNKGEQPSDPDPATKTDSDDSGSSSSDSSSEYSIWDSNSSLCSDERIDRRTRIEIPTPFDNNFWIPMNYLDVARAAQYCGAYLTSILYIEIAATEMDMSGPLHVDDDSDDASKDQFYSQGTSMYPQNRSEAFKMEKMLLKAYSNIGEEDAAFGCGSARFGDGSVHHVEQTRNWQSLLMMANGSSVDKDSCSDFLVSQSMKGLGIYNILSTYLKGVEAQNKILPEELHQAQSECSWRLSQWDVNTDKPAYIKDFVDVPPHSAFQMSIYDSIQTGLLKDKQNHLTSLRNGYRSIHAELRHASLESSVNLYGYLSRLQMLRVVEDFVGSEGDWTTTDVSAFLNKWKLQDRIPVGDFRYQEPALYLRNVLLRAYDENVHGVNLESEITESLLSLITKAREAADLEYADNCATALASLCTKPCLARELEVAKIKWARGKEHGRDALFMMSQLTKRTPKDDELYPNLLLRYGEWQSELHCERPTVILDTYLKKACDLYENRNGVSQQEIANANIVLAKYADAQYQNVTKYINSDVFQSKVQYVQRVNEERNQVGGVDRQAQIAASIMKKHCSNDDNEIKWITQEQRKFLTLALTHYLKGLKTSNEHDLLIFRAISLWLENGINKDEGLVAELTQIFSKQTMPSYKYIIVLHQLSARLNNKPSPMNTLLIDILVKCAEEHPYHTLPVLITQSYLHKDEPLYSKKTSSIQLAGRVQAANAIVQSLQRKAKLKDLVTKMESVWIALILLANNNEGRSNESGTKRDMSNDIRKKLMAGLEMVPVPTVGIPVLPSLNYKDSIIGISNFDKQYGFVGGINSPKKIACRGTNGTKYNMLLKGQDDLRQDAVMQQVFGVMNKLLQVEHKTKIRRLHIRTYKVVPLSQRTGVIEWVENTQTLGEYLVGSNSDLGAHVRYRPNDLKPMECRKRLQEARNGDAEKRFNVYTSICEHFKPVFRHFFFENFKEAGTFFEKRLAYTRSVATNSIVGYILGLGDRHVLNILIDQTTAELIHIDLGVAFEQGRILPTPELIPFRLSRDIIDGMGISGAEGVFRKSCEMTMEVLRRNAEIIITVLQVLLYDPLYMWTLSSDRVARVQPSDTTKTGRKSKGQVEQTEESVNERNDAASRVLLRLRQKLMGIEEEGGQTGAISSGSSISIDGHVSLLIQRAIDPEKLCKLFPGWQPYL